MLAALTTKATSSPAGVVEGRQGRQVRRFRFPEDFGSHARGGYAAVGVEALRKVSKTCRIGARRVHGATDTRFAGRPF